MKTRSKLGSNRWLWMRHSQHIRKAFSTRPRAALGELSNQRAGGFRGTHAVESGADDATGISGTFPAGDQAG